jgi:hypothetical protein
VIDEKLEADLAEARRLYPAPITNLPRLRAVLAAMQASERQRVLTAMQGYAAFIAECERKKKPRAVKDADRWVANGMWQGYLTSGEKAHVAGLVTRISIDSPPAKALVTLRKIGTHGVANERSTRAVRASDCGRSIAGRGCEECRLSARLLIRR